MESESSVDARSQLSVELDGNRLTFLPDGQDRLDALLGLIDGADRTLRLVYYIFRSDESGTRVRDALLAARGRGVETMLLIDGFGSEDVAASFFQPLIDAGCAFCRFEPRWGRRYLLRNHQKLALADERKALTGGFNISDAYFGGGGANMWRDLGVLVEGPAAAAIAPYCDELLAWSQAKKGRMREISRLLERHSQHEGRIRWLLAGPVPRLSPWTRAIRLDMNQASRIDLIAAYFSPNRAMLKRIYHIAGRGYARILTASKSDNGATIGAARHTYSRLLRRGVSIFEYQPSKLHTKLFVLDTVVHAGSANFDMRSLYLNLEIMLRIDDDRVAGMMRGFVDGEIGQSREISRALHRRRRSWFNRLKWALCYFIVATTDYNVTRRLNFGVKSR
jgi:cardiolipin synthase